MSDWLHNLPVLWMALLVFGLTYLVTAAIYAVITVFAVGERARSFKAISPGLLPPLGIIFGLFVVFTAAQVWTDNEKAKSEIDREASALRSVVIFATSFPRVRNSTSRVDPPLPDRILDPLRFKKFIDLGIGKGGVSPEIDARDFALVARDDGLQHRVPAVGAVNIAGAKGTAFQITELVQLVSIWWNPGMSRSGTGAMAKDFTVVGSIREKSSHEMVVLRRHTMRSWSVGFHVELLQLRAGRAVRRRPAGAR